MRRRDRREPSVDANAIQRRGEVGRRIGERAVEIEQDGVHGSARADRGSCGASAIERAAQRQHVVDRGVSHKAKRAVKGL